MTNRDEDVMELDILLLLRALWHKAWLIVLSMILCGVLILSYTVFFVTPLYESSALMYVNSSNLSLAGSKLSISQSDLTAAKSLIDTYTVILNTRTTLNDVIEEGELTCSYEELVKMISAEAVNGTEVFRITVTNPDPAEAALIANIIARVLPDKIASIVEGSSARIVDTAVVSVEPASPSYVKNTIIGTLIGMILSCAIIIIQELTDDKIYDSDYLIQTYDIPVLATIPDLMSTQGNGSYYYRSSDKKSGKQ